LNEKAKIKMFGDISKQCIKKEITAQIIPHETTLAD
jgi:hypothetical protein